MSMIEKQDSFLKMEALYFEAIDFKRSQKAIVDDEFAMRFSAEGTKIDKEGMFSSKLGINITSEDGEKFSLNMCLVGEFSIDPSILDVLDQETVDNIAKKNTLAILFPYLRSQVSLVTAQPGMSPIVIPPVNINSMFDKE